MDNPGKVELFVPGRLCLFGEHSDWAGFFRRQYFEIEQGYTIVAPTNQGTYAIVSRLDERVLRMKSTIDSKTFEIELPLEKRLLKEEAEKGGLFSYVAGTAYHVLDRYDNNHVGGLEIDNTVAILPEMKLPVKKGLSSSASVCVLVARAFNQLYDLKLTKKGEMDLAYRGEVLTPSRCGRMDQACAYDSPVLMSFDGDLMDLEELSVGRDFPFLIVDLNKGKDTKKILEDLNCHFFEESSKVRVREYLGKINKDIVFRARKAIDEGDLEWAGHLMDEAQAKFDEYLGPCCDELKAPKLHEVLEMDELWGLVYGGKGVGSQGDGCAQFLCKSKDKRNVVREILEEKGMECYDLDLKKNC